MASNLMNTRSIMQKRRAVESPDFSAVILVGNGENLYPLNQGTNILSKALLPVGNVPILNTVLDWVFESGLTDVLIVVPPSAYMSISDHLQENYSTSSHPRARIELKRYTDGEKEEDEESSEQGAAGLDKVGTARLLRRFKSYIKSDFVLLPCDISAPSNLPLSLVLDTHRVSSDTVLTSVFYEPVESVKDGEEKILVAMDKESNDLLLIKPVEGLEDDLDLRMSLLRSHPTLNMTTKLVDGHVYVFRRTVLDLISTRRPKDLDSIREQVVPWLVKGSWQQGLGGEWASILNPPRRDPLATALAASTSGHRIGAVSSVVEETCDSPASIHSPIPSSDNSQQSSGEQLLSFKAGLPVKNRRKTTVGWKCKVLVARPFVPSTPPTKAQQKGAKPPPAPEPEYLIRTNSLAGYWELNRRFIRSLGASVAASNGQFPSSSRPAAGLPSEDGQTSGLISASAQISPDTLIGDGTRVGERASIKKCIVGRHCVIGRGAKITGCILWDFVVVEENARIENTICCSNVRVGDKAQIKDCEFGTGFEALPGATLKGERLIAGQEA